MNTCGDPTNLTNPISPTSHIIFANPPNSPGLLRLLDINSDGKLYQWEYDTASDILDTDEDGFSIRQSSTARRMPLDGKVLPKHFSFAVLCGFINRAEFGAASPPPSTCLTQTVMGGSPDRNTWLALTCSMRFVLASSPRPS